jgi:Tol biopolymer transport system component
VPLAPGTRLGPYEISAQIGEGGMGEVYRATDINLSRQVAIKVLPHAVAADADRLTRFDREARTLASLNHPNIAVIYGVERSSAGTTAIAMELVEGPTLADRIEPGPIPVAEALAIARQIADALEAAHEQGIVHRDLKPANIKLARNGIVKVLDFGLAKTMTPTAAPALASAVPTVTSSGRTEVGTVLGTTAYMSPEQAKGLPVDQRGDVWAFACVLYEMLTGRRAFAGTTTAETIAAILEREVDWSHLPASTPASVRTLLRRALAKDPRRRLHHIADARLELDEAHAAPERATTESRRVPWLWIAISSVALVAVLGMVIGIWIGLGGTPSDSAPGAAEIRLQIPTPPTTDPASLAISPDARQLTFVATSGGRPMLWLRALNDVTARPLPKTEDATFPFWSPDGRSIGFFADRQLKRLDLELGTVRSLTRAEGGRGGTWSQDGIIVYQPTGGATALRRVAADGGASTELAVGLGRFPQFLPDGQHFIFSRTYGSADTETRGLYIGSLTDSTPKLAIELADSTPVLTGSNHVLFVREGTLFAQRLDVATLAVIGNASPIAAGLNVNPPLWLAPIAASRSGPILYRTGSAGGVREFVWFDRAGRELSRVGQPLPGLLSPSLSPDGQRLAIHRIVNGNTDIWMLDTTRGVITRFTTGEAAEFHPLWMPDGQRIVFNSGGRGLAIKSASGAGNEAIYLEIGRAAANDWSPDGRFIAYTLNEPNPSRDVVAMDVGGARKPIAVADTAFNERDAQFSPDGRWVAYTSDESGNDEVYVQRFPERSDRVQVSNGGGGMVRWRRDGREVFYVAIDGALMSVAITLPKGQGRLEAGRPARLFQARIGAPVQANSRQQYMVSPDGQRFLMNTLAEENAAPITVILNWQGRP